jgi:hypothetical protein
MRKSAAIRKQRIRRTGDAGLDRTMAPSNSNDPQSDPDSIESNVRAIFFQLLSARASMLRLYPEEICLQFMDDCIASFKAQHRLIDEEAREGIVWEETSMEALFRLLEYLYNEIDDGLKDHATASQLKLCIHRLAQILTL